MESGLVEILTLIAKVRMVKIVLLTKGTYGDVVPFICLGSALKRRGNCVVLISQCEYSEVARAAGLAFESWDTPRQYEAFVGDGPLLDTPHGIRTFAERHIFPQTTAEFAVLAKHCNEQTVLISRHMCSVAAYCIAELRNIPLLPLFPAVAHMECIGLLAAFYQSTMDQGINRLRAEYSLSPITDWKEWILSFRPFLACWPEWFAGIGGMPTEDVIHLGFMQSDEAETGELPADAVGLLHERPGPILITGGTSVWTGADSFYAVVAEACWMAGRSAMLVCRHAKLVPRQLPRDVFHFKQLPFASVIPLVSAVVHHGGASTMARALMSAVPQIIWPFGGDRIRNAEHVSKLGVGVQLPRSQWNSAAVARIIAAATSAQTISTACARVSEQLTMSNELEWACAGIEQVKLKLA